MQTFTTILALLSILAQSLSPAVGCEHLLGCCCTAELLETSITQPAESGIAPSNREETSRETSSGECQLLAADRPAPKSCCAARAAAVPHGGSSLADTPPVASDSSTKQPAGPHHCGCACHIPAPFAPVEAVRVFAYSIDWLPLLSAPGSLDPNGLTEVSGFSTQPEADDRTRPHRVSRCHLLDCLWLI